MLASPLHHTRLHTLFALLATAVLGNDLQQEQLLELEENTREWFGKKDRRRSEDPACASNIRWYDDVFQELVWKQTDATISSFDDLSDAALWVIDMQKDFTYGSFGFDCFNDVYSMSTLPGKIGKFAEMFVSRGGTVAASKDYHPDNHCSFEGMPDCVQPNTFVNPIKYEHMEMRYQNDFIVHCPFNGSTYEPFVNCCNNYVPHGSQTCPSGCDQTPFVATELHEDLTPYIDSLYKQGKASIFFKGMNETCDSFSGFQMGEEGTDEYFCTGGWAIPSTLSDYGDRATTAIEQEHPSKDQFETFPSGWTSARDALQGKARIFVSGVVFDFCVKDTSMYTQLNLGNETEVFVLTDLSRPSLNGLEAVGVPSFDFDLGTAQRTVAAAGDMLRGGVSFVTSGQMMCPDNKYIKPGGSCGACEEMQNGCATCNTYGMCTSAKKGYKLRETGYTYSCPDHCHDCSAMGVCDVCEDGYHVHENSCTKNTDGWSGGHIAVVAIVAVAVLVLTLVLHYFMCKSDSGSDTSAKTTEDGNARVV